jgi:FHA domain
VAPFNSDPNLIVVSAAGRTRQIPVPVNGIVLGRDARLGAPFSTDEFVSRNHASVQRLGDTLEIADLGSANGTYVNGALLHTPASMRDGDMLRIGQIQLKLAAAAQPAAAKPAAARPAAAAVSYRPDEQIIQHESFPSEIVATRTRARWLIWTVVVSFVAGFAIFALGPSLLHALATLF